MIEIEKAFNPETKSVHEFFQRPGVGFYIPLYQREYSWDEDNINQLLDDISSGISSIILENDDREVRFLGTIITVTEPNTQNIEPQDPQGLPSKIEKIIDGQQRLSTIALLASQLYLFISDIRDTLVKKDPEKKRDVDEICEYWLSRLEDVFSLDLRRGNPNRKPKIIRGSQDAWTKDGKIEDYYKSSVSSYLALCIKSIHEKGQQPKINKKEKVGKNVAKMASWIRNVIIVAHDSDTGDEFVPASQILTELDQKYIWNYRRDDLTALIADRVVEKGSFEYHLCSLVQLFAVTHYLLNRCCFTIIQPYNDDWAFDMFQSLNATGTPLTAIETFKPLVDNITKKCEQTFKGSRAEKSFRQIEKLFSNTKSASQKSKRTNDFLSSFGIIIDGGKLQSHFSKQRKWLESVYSNRLTQYDQQVEFVELMANFATFYDDYWIHYDGTGGNFDRLPHFSHNDSAWASILLLLLRDSNHKMALTILGRFFHFVALGEENSIANFIEVTKATGAFYILWRSALSNSGLDNAYREFFKGTKDIIFPSRSWLNNNRVAPQEVKDYFNWVLDKQGIGNKADWKSKATRNLRFDHSKPIARFAVFVSANDTIPDSNGLGLMKKGVVGCASYNSVDQWISPDLKSTEHIAPIKGANTHWDARLYDEDEWYQSVGNLTLLPNDVNTSASNRGWKEKYLYFRHLSEADIEKQLELRQKAKMEDISLSEKAIEILKSAKYNKHVLPIVAIGENGEWNLEIVKKRADRICDLLWDQVAPWLEVK